MKGWRRDDDSDHNSKAPKIDEIKQRKDKNRSYETKFSYSSESVQIQLCIQP